MTHEAVLGIDVGGTGVKAILSAADGTVLGRWRRPTPTDDPTSDRTRELILELVEVATAVAAPIAVGVAIPGIVDEDRGLSIHSMNLGWRDLPVAELLRASLDVPLAFAHDVRAGALAEATSGAASAIDGTVAFVPVGTGLASALVIDGVTLSGGGWAGEIGQRLIQHGPHRGLRVEQIASASGVARLAGAPDAKSVAEAVVRGSARETAAWNEAVDILADALVDIVVVAAPAAIVVGGGLALAGSVLFEPLEQAVRERLTVVPIPPLLPAAHGDEAAIIGAAILARRLVEA